MLTDTERHYEEAMLILQGKTMLQPSIVHLQALFEQYDVIHEQYEVRLIEICNELEKLKRKTLNG